MNEIKAGSEDAFVEMVHRHQPPLLNFFRRMGVNRDEAEELVQETFLRLFKYRRRYEPSAKFTTWLYRLARSALVDRIRRKTREFSDRGRFGEDAADPLDFSRIVERKMDCQAALNTLSEKLKSVVVLNIYQGFTYREIAEILDIPTGTVKSRMFFALRKLKERFYDNP